MRRPVPEHVSVAVYMFRPRAMAVGVLLPRHGASAENGERTQCETERCEDRGHVTETRRAPSDTERCDGL